LIGLADGTGMVEVTDPANPIYLGKLPTHTATSSWHDIKVCNDPAFIVSEAAGHGMQVFDLAQLLSVASPPVTFPATTHYNNVGNAYNIAINEDTGFAYILGGQNGCSGGLHMVDISTTTLHVQAGCFGGEMATPTMPTAWFTTDLTSHSVEMRYASVQTRMQLPLWMYRIRPARFKSLVRNT
jgi:choice-of-anchor B domain-containing protein